MNDDKRPPKVAAIVDQYTLVINIGSDDGIGEGQRFLIYGLGPEIIDPDSGRPLGPLEVVRGRGRAVHVQSTMSTLKSIDVIEQPGTKRIIKRTGSIFALGGTEEIEEGSSSKGRAFIDPRVGDFARKI